MKVLLLCSTPEYTGPAELMLEDAVALREAGHEVTVAFDTLRQGSLRERVRSLDLPVDEGLFLTRKFNPRAIFQDVSSLRKAVAEGRYDTLHCRFSNDHHAALLAAVGTKRERVRIVRSTELLENVAPGVSRALPYGLTDAFAVPSHAHLSALAEVHRIPEDRIHLLPGRVDGERFRPGPSTLLDELGIPKGAPVAGIVSRIKPDRRHVDLIRAFSRVLQRLPEARLILIGRGEGIPMVKETIERLGVGERVLFAGYRVGPELEDAYRALDVKAWIAQGNDGTCRAVLEAMASGCAILGGRFGAVAEMVADGRTGRLFDPDDAGELAEALFWLLSDKSRARALGKAGRERALEMYHPRRRIDALHSLYQRAWAKPPPSGGGSFLSSS